MGKNGEPVTLPVILTMGKVTAVMEEIISGFSQGDSIQCWADVEVIGLTGLPLKMIK